MLKIMLPLLLMLIITLMSNKSAKIWWPVTVTLILLSFVSLLYLPNYLMMNSYLSMLDNMSHSLITLSILIAALMMMTSTKILHNNLNPKLFILYNLLLLMTLVLCFSAVSIFSFYIMFEASLIPTMLIIMSWGYQPERVQASMYMMLYTITASLPMLMMFIYYYMNTKSTSLINQPQFIPQFNLLMALLMIMGFLVKLPMFTTHLWLPKAHVEAPIAGSMVLAAILLKLGGYGTARVMMLIPSQIQPISTPLIALSLVGAIATSIICIRQPDLKSMIAYSSVGHMGLMLSGILTNSKWGLWGALLIMIAHALTSSALFALANLTYEMSHTRSLFLMKGMYVSMPILSAWWFIFCAINMAAPPSINLLSEIMLMMSISSYSLLTIPMLMIITFLTGVYSLIMYSATQHGFNHKLNNPYPLTHQKNYSMLLMHLMPIILLILKPSMISIWT